MWKACVTWAGVRLQGDGRDRTSAPSGSQVERALWQFGGNADVLHFYARMAELGLPGGAQLAQSLLAGHGTRPLRLATAGLGQESSSEEIGAVDQQRLMAGLARLCRAGNVDPAKVKVEDHATGKTVPLSNHPYFPGNPHRVMPEWPALPAPAPLGEGRLKTWADVDGPALFSARDADLLSLVIGPSPRDSAWLATRLDKEKGNPAALNLAARMAEAFEEDRNNWDYGRQQLNPRLDARRYILEHLPRRTLTNEEIPALLRLAKAAKVPLDMLACKGPGGTQMLVVDHPGFRALHGGNAAQQAQG